MFHRKTWKEFTDSGLLWMINRTLHIFGWCILVVEVDGKDYAYPARTNYRGFPREVEDEGYRKVTQHMAENAEALSNEVKEQP